MPTLRSRVRPANMQWDDDGSIVCPIAFQRHFLYIASSLWVSTLSVHCPVIVEKTFIMNGDGGHYVSNNVILACQF